jgi:hypothetical protein
MKIQNIWYWFEDFLYDIKTLLTNDTNKWENLTYEMNDIDKHCKCEKQTELLDTDFYIEEWFDSKEKKVKFTVYKNLLNAALGSKYCCGSFYNLTEAKEHLNNERKYKTPIIHRH